MTEQTIDRELVEQWIAALESGAYKQGRHTLRTANDEYCCLGVLCDVAGGEWGGRTATATPGRG